jgi:hypothetical protein
MPNHITKCRLLLVALVLLPGRALPPKAKVSSARGIAKSICKNRRGGRQSPKKWSLQKDVSCFFIKKNKI